MKIVKIKGKRYLTVAGFAEKHGVSRTRVYHWAVRDGRIKCIINTPTLLIPFDTKRPEDLRAKNSGRTRQ